MKDFLKVYWTTIGLIVGILVHYYATNATIVGFASVLVWAIVLLSAAIALAVAIMTIGLYSFDDKVYVTKIKIVHDPIVAKDTILRRLIGYLTTATILGLFIYTEWVGPATVYLIFNVIVLRLSWWNMKSYFNRNIDTATKAYVDELITKSDQVTDLAAELSKSDERLL